MVTRAPASGALSRVSVALWLSTMLRTMARPRPVPASLVVKKGSRMRSGFPGRIPARSR